MATNQAAITYSNQHIHTCCCMGMGFIRVDVPISHELFGQAIPCICRRDTMERETATRNRRLSQISETQVNKWKFADYLTNRIVPLPGVDIKDAIKQANWLIGQLKTFALRPRGWIILQGTYGSGKTHLAYAAAIEALASGHSVYANTINDLLEDLRNSYNGNAFEDRLRFLKSVDLLVIDDLGAQRDTLWAADSLYQIINYRYANDLPLLVTTNLDTSNPDCGIEPRILSRLLDGTSAKGKGNGRLFSMPAGDYRRSRELRGG